jgi:FixJ family two-component response regulator
MQPDGLTVYIVEDDASVRDSLALMLGLAGYRTVFFPDAETLLAVWRKDWAGCVVADVKLPGASGIELQAELRRRGSGLPFIIITAHGDVAAARAAFRADAVDFLEKPFDHGQLRAAIQSAFSKEDWRLRRADESGRLALLTARCSNTRRKDYMQRKSRARSASAFAPSKSTRPGSCPSSECATWPSSCASRSWRTRETAKPDDSRDRVTRDKYLAPCPLCLVL